MTRFTLTYLKPFAIFLSITVLFQCCVVYDKQPITIEEAVNVDHKIVKPIKVEMENGERIIVDSLYYKENELFGLELESEDVVVPSWTETKYTKSGEPYTYTHSTVQKVNAVRKIEENEIYKIFIPERPKNNIYVNLVGGDGSLYSINYERLFKVSPTLILAGGLGVGRAATDIIWGDALRTLPHHITLNYGKGNVLLEFGIGGVNTINLTSDYYKGERNYLIYPIIGFRVQPIRPPIRFFFRLRFILPVDVYEEINWGWDTMLIVPIGIGLGVSF